MPKDKWIFITAGLGSSAYNLAAKRLADEFAQFELDVEIQVLTEKNLSKLCPSFENYSRNLQISKTKGYGYWYWKAELVFRAFQAESSRAVGVIWLDSGSEIFASRWTKARLVQMLKLASEQGVLTYALNTKEDNYTKVEAIEYFGAEINGNSDIQFQANFFMLHGRLGKKIATEWFEIISRYPELLNDATRRSSPGFVEHRHDQSIFSMVCKRNGVLPAISPPPTARNGIKSVVKAALSPIWISRNRSGASIKPKWLTSLGKISIKQGGSNPSSVH